MKILTILLFLLSTTACDVSFIKTKSVNALEKLQGTWKACQNNSPTDSTQVQFQFVNDQISESISQWDQADCTGTETPQFQFTAVVVIESKTGQSTYSAGATDIHLTPDVDLFGCGAGNPSYTFIKFINKNYNSFNPSLDQPSCDPTMRGSQINQGLTFIKQ